MLCTNERIAKVLDELLTPVTNQKVANVIETIRDEYEATLIEKNARIAGLESGIRSMRHSLADDECSCTTPPSDRTADEIAGGCCGDDDNPECHSGYCPVYLAHYAGRLLEQREAISC